MKDMRTCLIEFMEANGYEISYVAKETNIAMEKLDVLTDCPLNATELCTLCSYLGIWPEWFYEKQV